MSGPKPKWITPFQAMPLWPAWYNEQAGIWVSPPNNTMNSLRRPAAGVLLGLAASITALIAVLLISWGHCGGGSGEDCDVQVAVASLAAVPGLLLVAAVLLLLSARASKTFVGTFLVVLTLFVAVLPLAILSIREWWSVVAFGALLSGLVGYIVAPQRGETGEAFGPRSGSGVRRRAAPSRTPEETSEELWFWLNEVKARTIDLRRELRNLGRR
jgi:hypothetical protein